MPPFVSRRVNTIKQEKQLEFCYINSENNPADVATRPETWSVKRELWFRGPEFLKKSKDEWPEKMYPTAYRSLLTHHQENDISGDIGKMKEIEAIIKLQQEHFPQEVSGQETDLTKNLGLYFDVDGVLRCKGRMANANWSYESKHPILIPKNCEFTNQLIQETHESNYHVGVSHTLSLIRQKFWIPQGRTQVQKVLRRCKNCIKYGGGPYSIPPSPNLPKERINFTAPFSYSGMDYFGPIFVNGPSGTEKRWVCLFTCLVVRAIHMEMVKDLTAEECLLALRRFSATRGKPMKIYSDNASLFKLTSEVLAKEVEWKFIPQLAPWHGGFYERMIGVVKHCMKRSLEKHLLKDSQIITVIKEVDL